MFLNIDYRLKSEMVVPKMSQWKFLGPPFQTCHPLALGASNELTRGFRFKLKFENATP